MIRLEFDGADELIADMQKLVSDYPKEASDALFEVAENFNEDVNAKMPGSYGNKIRKWGWKRPCGVLLKSALQKSELGGRPRPTHGS